MFRFNAAYLPVTSSPTVVLSTHFPRQQHLDHNISTLAGNTGDSDETKVKADAAIDSPRTTDPASSTPPSTQQTATEDKALQIIEMPAGDKTGHKGQSKYETVVRHDSTQPKPKIMVKVHNESGRVTPDNTSSNASRDNRW